MGATFEEPRLPRPEVLAALLPPLDAAVVPPLLLAAARAEAVVFLLDEDDAFFRDVAEVVLEAVPLVLVSLSAELLLAAMRHLNGRRPDIVHTANLIYPSFDFQ